MFTLYVEIKQPIITSITKELGKLANILAERPREVGFTKNAHKCEVTQNWIRFQQERTMRPHYSAM